LQGINSKAEAIPSNESMLRKKLPPLITGRLDQREGEMGKIESTEPEFVNCQGVHESIPKNRFLGFFDNKST
jgi:hypothetical protein